MISARKFPVILQEGGIIIRIERSPMKIRIRPRKSTEPNGRGRPRTRTHKLYDSYLVVYYDGTRRKRDRQSTYQKARSHADKVLVRLLNKDTEALKLAGRDGRIHQAALESLSGIPKPLDHVAKEYADCTKLLQPFGFTLTGGVEHLVQNLKRLNGAALGSAVECYERYGASVRERKKVPEITKELLKNLNEDGKGHYHIRDLRVRLGRFGQSFPGMILDISTAQINDWLRSLRKLSRWKAKNEAKDPLEGKTRNNYRNAVVQLFNFARDHDYLPQERKTAAERTKLAKESYSENEIFTPEEMATLLSSAPPHIVPGMVVKAFGGVRTEEIAKVQWEDVLFEQNCIRLSGAITKKSQRRIVPMHENLRAWLEPVRQKSGRLCERWTTPQSVYQAWVRYAKGVKMKDGRPIPVGENRFRNSFISYRVAETQDIAKTALESGNSPQVIRDEYMELTTPEAAAKWFAIFPAGYQSGNSSVRTTSEENGAVRTGTQGSSNSTQ